MTSYVLYQHHHCHVTQPLLLEQLREWGVDISAGQINRLLLEDKEAFHREKDGLLKVALAPSPYVTVDDTGARHQGHNGYVTHMGNAWMAWFESTCRKTRQNFLSLLRAGFGDCHLSDIARKYMEEHQQPVAIQAKLAAHNRPFDTEQQWLAFLDSLGITGERHRRIATEGALFASAIAHGFCTDLVIVSDDAGQFNVFKHALCWVHTERLVHKLVPLNDNHGQAITHVREKIWDYYAALKAYQQNPDPSQADHLTQQFDQIFSQRTCYETLNQTLKRIRRNKDGLLMVLEHPQVPLHTNGSEADIRDYVKKRKVSGGTRSGLGRQARDTFASLKKTCRKLGISFWQYLTARLGVSDQAIPPLPDILLQKMAHDATAY